MRRLVVWYYLLNKRLFKKYSFILILCLVPFLVGAMRMAIQDDSGVMRLALCLTNEEDQISAKIVDSLMSEEGLLKYTLCTTEEEARELLIDYKVDAVWLFPENLKKDLQNAAQNKKIQPVITVIEREDNIALLLTREVLCKELYSFFSYEAYVDFIRDDIGLEEVSTEELQEAYNQTLVDGSLFQMEYLDGEQAEEISYLLAPIRGILSLWLVLCGFTASMYFIQDERNGVYARIPIRNRLLLAFAVQAVLLSDAIIVLLFACKVAGIITVWYREILSAVLFAGCTMVFCNVVRLLCRTMERLGSCIPILLMGMLVLCPVFLDMKKWRAIQYLLPPYYYLKSIHSMYYINGMVIYIAVMAIICVLIFRWQNRKLY